jgi:hypothetical protein
MWEDDFNTIGPAELQDRWDNSRLWESWFGICWLYVGQKRQCIDGVHSKATGADVGRGKTVSVSQGIDRTTNETALIISRWKLLVD